MTPSGPRQTIVLGRTIVHGNALALSVDSAIPSAVWSIYYAAGLMEGMETIGFFAAFCVLPDHFALMAWVFGGLCWLTTAFRIAAAVTAFGGDQT